jgi:hypothetical protein
MTPPEFPQDPVPLVFIDDHGDVSAFRSSHDAATWIEPIDVQNREYIGYDSLGRLLELSTDGRSVHIGLAELTPAHAGQLLATLRSFLRASGDPVADDPSFELPEIASYFMRYVEIPPRSLWQALTSLFHTRS